MSRRAGKPAPARVDRTSDGKSARDARVQSFMLALGYAIVGLSVVAGFVLSFRPQVLGQQAAPPAVAFGVAALAGFRLYALRMELRRQAEETTPRATRSATPKRRGRALGKRA
jgi:hypothetical protein